MMIVETFLLVLAVLFPVINPPGTALVFLGVTRYASANTRRLLARRVAVNVGRQDRLSWDDSWVLGRGFSIALIRLRNAQLPADTPSCRTKAILSYRAETRARRQNQYRH